TPTPAASPLPGTSTSTSTQRPTVKKKKAQGRPSSSGATLLSPRRQVGSPPQVLEQDEEDRWHDITDEDEEPSLVRFLPRRPQLLPSTIYSPLQLFQLFFSSSVVRTLVDNTNKFGEVSAAAGKKIKWAAVSVSEFYAFIGIIVYMGLVKVKSITDLWSKKQLYQFPFPSTVMSSKRFAAISSNLHLSDPQEDEENMKKKGTPAYDKLFKIKPLYTDILSACRSFFQPRREFPHTLLDFSLLGHGYRVYMENFYTSPTLFTDLLQNNTLACGTIRSNQQGFPHTKRNDLPKRAERGTIRWYRHGKLLYVKWMDTRELTMCSTMHKAYKGDTVRRRVKHKQGVWSTTSVPIPAAVKDYNKHMGGVDLSDALIGYYNVLHKSRKWYKTFFFHFIDIGIVNSFILHQQLSDIHGQAALTQKAFREALVIELTNVMKRSEEVAGPSGPSKQPAQEKCMPAFFSDDATAGRRKCENCEKEGQQTKTPFFCAKCGVALCLVPTRNCFKQWHDEKVGNT
uniref:PiggyBac transposable element-derived protein domain-containing protein n=1 Tax=Pygocentrus nattereri TaxID=42514 RepID=A0AAR2LHE2_PYGNA